jgi:hypothetical protein
VILSYNGVTLVNCEDKYLSNCQAIISPSLSSPNYTSYSVSFKLKNPDDIDDSNDNDFDTPIIVE